MKPLKKIITIEEHFILKNISQKVAAFNIKENGGIAPNDVVQKELMKIGPTSDDIEDIGERRIKFMDESGIDVQVLSYGAGSPQNITDKTLAIELCREANDKLANLVKLHPTRFAGLATLPVADPAAAGEELNRHWGELVPFFLNRLDDQLSKTLKLDRKISDYYKSGIYVTPSELFSDAQLKYVIDELGADKIIYSGDYPYLIDKGTRQFLETAHISREAKEKIGYKNAEKLLHL
jgi:predicted TIM-barrel fold metal-dependent hydrolase